MPKVKVVVTLKPTLLDAQGRVVQDALHAMGYANVEQVRIGKYMELELTAGEQGDAKSLETEIKEMCDRLLANPVIENYHYEVMP
jgi:phosphoribosylformylglycinamidine synthase PurS subunit